MAVEEGQKDRTLIRTITACLVSATARIVIDVTFMPAKKNEMSPFNSAFDELMKVYGRSDLFCVVTYDAGATSKPGAQHAGESGTDPRKTVQFKEDDHLFVPTHVNASLSVMVLRRVVLSLFALFRNVSLRANRQRGMPWRELLDWAYRTLISATASQLDGLRRRRKVALATS